MPEAPRGRTLQFVAAISFNIKDEREALDAHLALWEKNSEAEKKVQEFIWTGQDVEAILELAQRIGVPDEWAMQSAQTVATTGAPTQIMQMMGWFDEGSAVRKSLFDKLMMAEPGEWLRVAHVTHDLSAEERKAILAAKATAA